MKTQDFDYDLPPELIAQFPVQQRTHSRLLHLDGAGGALRDRRFRDLPGHLRPGDVVVMNDTRVIKARLFGRKESGGRVEILVERVLDGRQALAQLRASHGPRPGTRLMLDCGARLEVGERQGEFYRLEFPAGETVLELLERHGSLPLPPYISRPPEDGDEARYQTVYARQPGAVAAPTAGLHFDEAALAAVREAGAELAYLTLHVGAGTFQPVRVEDVAEHRMHSERYHVPQATVAAIERARARGGRVLAVGTTTLRALEAAAVDGALAAGWGETDIFIVPGYRFRVVDILLTNFHLPRSTLLMLVSAFGGVDNVRRAYRHAVREKYRFFSYGDAMLIEGGRSGAGKTGLG